ncbi:MULTISPECIES: cupin domain-containing protein [Pseudoalteromonas]|uniref:Cupin n=1 Tax=Pseudoalteromonas amylolytica TaxID=1859457 RepID=A0A1S1MP01_9GAMM|nr:MULTISPECIES: cupin domain-containing protein [Pseudoalteromonas]OHU84409.1 cupin [Pseudoalteromonas sp. JW3]OHU87051.1 cupin [Pseudoalteromonas amylolytica]
MISVLNKLVVATAMLASGVVGAESSTPEQGKEVSFSVVAKSTQSWDGSQLPQYPKGQPEVTILKVVIPAGATVVQHKHPMINAGVMLKGKLTVTSEDGKVLHLGPGDPIIELVNTWHEGKNEGDEPVEILVFYAGVKGMPLSIKHTD